MLGTNIATLLLGVELCFLMMMVKPYICMRQKCCIIAVSTVGPRILTSFMLCAESRTVQHAQSSYVSERYIPLSHTNRTLSEPLPVSGSCILQHHKISAVRNHPCVRDVRVRSARIFKLLSHFNTHYVVRSTRTTTHSLEHRYSLLRWKNTCIVRWFGCGSRTDIHDL